MKKIINRIILVFFLSLIVFTNCNSDNRKNDPQININELRNHVDFLVSTPNYRNYKNIESLNICANYIKEQFVKNKITTEEQSYKIQDKLYKNIIGKIGNQNKKIIVIGAHYDVHGNQDGADDNASGVAGLIELAKALKEIEKKLNYQVHFVAYTLEEMPYFNTKLMGSYIHAKSMKEKNKQIKLMICFEMIGYFSDKTNSQNYPIDLMNKIYPDKGNFIAVVGDIKSFPYLSAVKKMYNKHTKIPCEILAAPKGFGGISLSDHRNYWAFGYNAIMITDTSFLRNKNYHKKSDTIETLNFDKMKEVIKGIYYYINFL